MVKIRWVAVAWTVAASSATLVAWSQSDTIRQWSDTTGKYRVEAAYTGVADGKVQLRRVDGSTLEVPLDRLSDADREFALRQIQTQATPTTKPKATPKVVGRDERKNKKSSGPAAAPVDWPQWRGPNRDGISHETGLLDQWPEDGPPLLWKVGELGSGYSSVAVAQGKIFTLGRLNGVVKLLALDQDGGRLVWSADVGRSGSDPNGTPTVADELVFGVTLDGELLCAETATGKEIWRKSFPNDFGGKMMSGWGYSESVLVDGDKVICTPGSQQAMLAALDKRTGRVLWTTPMPEGAGKKGQDGAGYSSIVVSQAAGTKQYIQLVGRGVIGVDAKSGELLWGYNDVANGTANIPTPIIKDDYVFCSTGYGDGGSALLKLNGGRGGITPQVVYSHPANKVQNHHGGMILLGNHIYMGHGHNNGFPLCLDFMTGRDAWRPGRGPGEGSAAVAYADGHLYFRYENGVMALIEATPEAYRLKGQFRIAIHGKSWSHPVIAGGRLYLRDQHELVCYDLRAK